MSKRERTRLLTSLGIAAGIGLVLVLAYQFHLFTTAQQTSHDLFYRLQNPDRYGGPRHPKLGPTFGGPGGARPPPAGVR